MFDFGRRHTINVTAPREHRHRHRRSRQHGRDDGHHDLPQMVYRDPSHYQREIRERERARADWLVADRIARGRSLDVIDPVDRRVDVALQAPRIDAHEAHSARPVRRIAGSRMLHQEPELPFRELWERKLTLEAEIHFENERALQAELAVARRRADDAEARFELENNRDVEPLPPYQALDRNPGPDALESFIEGNGRRAASSSNERTRFDLPAPEMSMRQNPSSFGYSSHSRGAYEPMPGSTRGDRLEDAGRGNRRSEAEAPYPRQTAYEPPSSAAIIPHRMPYSSSRVLTGADNSVNGPYELPG